MNRGRPPPGRAVRRGADDPARNAAVRIEVALVADDLTGALDAAAPFATCGLPGPRVPDTRCPSRGAGESPPCGRGERTCFRGVRRCGSPAADGRPSGHRCGSASGRCSLSRDASRSPRRCYAASPGGGRIAARAGRRLCPARRARRGARRQHLDPPPHPGRGPRRGRGGGAAAPRVVAPGGIQEDRFHASRTGAGRSSRRHAGLRAPHGPRVPGVSGRRAGRAGRRGPRVRRASAGDEYVRDLRTPAPRRIPRSALPPDRPGRGSAPGRPPAEPSPRGHRHCGRGDGCAPRRSRGARRRPSERNPRGGIRRPCGGPREPVGRREAGGGARGRRRGSRVVRRRLPRRNDRPPGRTIAGAPVRMRRSWTPRGESWTLRRCSTPRLRRAPSSRASRLPRPAIRRPSPARSAPRSGKCWTASAPDDPSSWRRPAATPWRRSSTRSASRYSTYSASSAPACR